MTAQALFYGNSLGVFKERFLSFRDRRL